MKTSRYFDGCHNVNWKNAGKMGFVSKIFLFTSVLSVLSVLSRSCRAIFSVGGLKSILWAARV